MLKYLGSLVAVVALMPVGCTEAPDGGQGDERSTGSKRQAVIGGELDPETLGVPISRLEKEAVVAQVVTVAGTKYQGCTGTLVGDRLVVMAGHCLISNQPAWQAGKAEPDVAPAEDVEYVVGQDVDNPLCTLKVESVHLSPLIDYAPGIGPEHDLAFAVLAASAIEQCPHVIPLQLNQTSIETIDITQSALQGGFGSLDGSYDFSPIRHWSLGEYSAYDDYVFTVKQIGKGAATFGDSGSGALYRAAHGALQVLGVLTGTGDGFSAYTRLDQDSAFIASMVTLERLCGDVDANGVCIDDMVVICDARGFRAVSDCTDEGKTCALDPNDKATCVCACDQEAYCEADCPCDTACPCECNVTDACDADCDCDADCFVPGGDQQQADAGADAGLDPDQGSDPGPAKDQGVAPEAPTDDDGGCTIGSGHRAPQAGGLLLLLIALVALRRRA